MKRQRFREAKYLVQREALSNRKTRMPIGGSLGFRVLPLFTVSPKLKKIKRGIIEDG